MHKVIFDYSKITTEDVKRFMEYGMGYVSTMDYLIDLDEPSEDWYNDEYIKSVRPAILKLIKIMSGSIIEKMNDKKNKIGFNLETLDVYNAFIGLHHHLDSCLEFYKAKNINMLGVPIDQVQKDFEYIKSRLKSIEEFVLDEKDSS